MGSLSKWVASCLALAGVLAGVPASADTGMSAAEKLRRLDIMLMVTGLRCRTGAEDFRNEYGQFTTAHLAELNAASDAMKVELSGRHGQQGAVRALDRLSVTMANAYGQGHPWLSCGELKMVARGLAAMRGTSALVEAADQLLSPVVNARHLAYARR